VIFKRPPDFIVGTAEYPYLLRWWVIPRNKWFNIYLHKFIRSDDDRALHDHRAHNLSIILRGGYFEYFAKGPHPHIPRHRGVGYVVFRRAATAHRIELLPGQVAWTLFVTGPHIREWGFHCPKGWMPWQQFTKPDSPGEIGPGCD
jgi:hypothetical protein